MDFFDQMEARIPRGEVRTRFAPSPTGYMHIGNLRTALYTLSLIHIFIGFCPLASRRMMAKQISKIGTPKIRNGTANEMMA